jgi:PST family polysaccharide transporter/lipopolysaccharide exporter
MTPLNSPDSDKSVLKSLKRAARFALAEGGSVKTRVLRSGILVGLSEAVLATVILLRSVVLARLLTPEVIGLMALAGIAIRTIETIARPGIAQALIARRGQFEEVSETAFTILVGRGVLLAIALAVAAPWVADFFEADALEPMLQVLSLVFVIGGFVNINTISQQREIEFRRLTYLSQATTLGGTVVTIAAAYWLRSVWALVIGHIAAVIINMGLSYFLVGGRPRFGFDGRGAKGLLAYGKFITGSSIVFFIANEVDSAAVAKLLGPAQLGYYTMAMTTATMITANLTKVVSSIMMPAYSKLQTDLPALRNAYLRTLSLVMLVVLPTTLGLITVAEPFVRVVFGERWMPTVVPLQILAVFGFVRALVSFNGYLFEGIGLPGVPFKLGLLRVAVILPLLLPMIHKFGLAGAAVTVAVGIACQWLFGLYYLRKHIGIVPGHLAKVIWRPLWTSAGMVLAVVGLMHVVETNTVFGLLAVVAGGVIVFALPNLPLIGELKRQGLK